jgi:hypothetical protein
MNKIWNTISFKKFDLTKYGHWSGTGIIDFDNNIELELQ